MKTDAEVEALLIRNTIAIHRATSLRPRIGGDVSSDDIRLLLDAIREGGSMIREQRAEIARLTPLVKHECAHAEANIADLTQRIAELEEALRMLHDETADYVRINNLGDPWHNQSMKMARAALAQTKQEPKYGGGGAVGVPVGAEIKWTEPPDAKS